jgi:hypothetical protein
MSYSYGQPQPQYLTYPSPGYAYPARRSAGPSVHLVAILQYLGGVAALGAAVLIGYLAKVAPTRYYDASNAVFDRGMATMVLGVAAGAIGLSGLISILLGRKLQRGRQWARVLMINVAVVTPLKKPAPTCVGSRPVAGRGRAPWFRMDGAQGVHFLLPCSRLFRRSPPHLICRCQSPQRVGEAGTAASPGQQRADRQRR